tara:strand:+ start:387 stop:638 length:252 start_codon:yes stop_codon:yes gene_type:complete
MSSSKKRFLPSLSQVERASIELPSPDSVTEDTYSVQLGNGNSDYKITFEKVKFSSRTTGKTTKWIFNGKILIPSSAENDPSKR